MVFIAEAFLSGCISKVINDGKDYLWTKIKKVVNDRSNCNLSTKIYRIIENALNIVTDKKFEDTDISYEAMEKIFIEFRDNGDTIESVKCGLRLLNVDDSIENCEKFLEKFYEEIRQDDDLYKTINMMLQQKGIKISQEGFQQINEKLENLTEKVSNRNDNEIDLQNKESVKIRTQEYANKVEINANSGGQAIIVNEGGTAYVTQNNLGEENSDIKSNCVKFQNNKKCDYIKTWNSRMFLHIDNDENPLTLADAFIMPDYKICAYIKNTGFFINNTLQQTIEKFINYNETSTMLIVGVPGMGKTTIVSWLANKYKMDKNVIILRFREWESDILDKGILKAICKTLVCKKEDLENKVLILEWI